MAAIAALAKAQGWRVSGSDAGVYPPMSDYLQGLGIEIAPYAAANLEPKPDLCLIGNAMSRGHIEVEAILDRGLAYTSGPAFVGDYLLPGRDAWVVAGTHGKTSTASLLAFVLDQAGLMPGFLIGGVPEDFAGGARLGRDGAPFVLEGDEYDTAFFDKRSKFLHYHARTLIINNIEYDHADIFPDLAAIQQQFHHLIRTVPASGCLIANADDANVSETLARGCWTPVTYFARYPHSDARWQWQPLRDDGSAFRLYRDGEVVMKIKWQMIGVHHIGNACAVAAAAAQAGVALTDIAAALQRFGGVRRRMTLVGEACGVKVFDDFAHHPTAIRAMVAAAHAQLRGQTASGRLWVVVEPRSNTMRSRIHQQRLPDCFAGADRVVFAAPTKRNLPDDALLDVDWVCRQIGSHATAFHDTASIVSHIVADVAPGDHLLVLSNGGFEDIHHRLLDAVAAELAEP